MKQKVLIIGGGNIGTEFACEFAAAGYEVNLYTSHPEKFHTDISMVDSSGKVLCEGRIAMATNDIRRAMAGCLLVFVIVPAFMFRQIADLIEPYVTVETCIGVVPGTGGAEFAFSGCMDKGAVLFGLQRVPGVARLVEYGSKVCVEGKRDELFLASIPGNRATELSRIIEEVIRIPCHKLPNYLNVTLTPSNPILHTTRLRTLFGDYREGVYYGRNPLFYGEWSMESSELLLACDDELNDLKAALDPMDLSLVKSLRVHYESQDAQQLTEKIRSIRSLHDLKSPMKLTEKGWIPDFQSRYFCADFPYGLAILIGIADILHVQVPHMEDTMKWYKELTGDRSKLDLHILGITCKDDFCRLYSK